MPYPHPRYGLAHAACLSSKTRTARGLPSPPLVPSVAGSATLPLPGRRSPRWSSACPPATAGGFALLLPPRPPERRARQGAAPGRAACARPAGAGLRFPPPAGPPSAGVRTERAGRSAAVLRSSLTPLALNILPPPLSLSAIARCASVGGLPPSAVWPSSRPAFVVTLFAGLSFSRSPSSRLRPASRTARRWRACRSPPPGGSGLRSRLRPPDPQNPNPGARGEAEEHSGGQRLRRWFRRSRSRLRRSRSHPGKPSSC